jgi:AcrR family transcriptional regulator
MGIQLMNKNSALPGNQEAIDSIMAIKKAIIESTKLGAKEATISLHHLEKLIFNVPVPRQAPKKNKKTSCMEKKDNIFKAAIEVFAEEGYHKATMEKIATLSGVAKGSVYRHFKSKEYLLEQLIFGKFQEIIEHMEKIYSKNSDILQEVEELIEFWVGYIEDNHELYRLIQNKAIFHRTGQKFMFYNYVVSHLPMIKERIMALSGEKKLKITNFYTVFYGVLGFIDGVTHKWFRSGMAYSLRSEIPVILEVIFNGFVGEKGMHRQFLPLSIEEKNYNLKKRPALKV